MHSISNENRECRNKQQPCLITKYYRNVTWGSSHELSWSRCVRLSLFMSFIKAEPATCKQFSSEIRSERLRPWIPSAYNFLCLSSSLFIFCNFLNTGESGNTHDPSESSIRKCNKCIWMHTLTVAYQWRKIACHIIRNSSLDIFSMDNKVEDRKQQWIEHVYKMNH